MNKKAQFTSSVLAWLVRISFTIAVIWLIAIFIDSSLDRGLDLDDMRFYPLAQRALYSPSCFVYEKDSRAYPGIIDSGKFSQNSLDQCMKIIQKSIGGRYVLEFGKSSQEIYYDKERYDDIRPLAFSNLYQIIAKRYFVLVEKDGELIPGNLFIELIWRVK